MSGTPEPHPGTVALACPVCAAPVTFHIRRALIEAEPYGLSADINAVADHHCSWSGR